MKHSASSLKSLPVRSTTHSTVILRIGEGCVFTGSIAEAFSTVGKVQGHEAAEVKIQLAVCWVIENRKTMEAASARGDFMGRTWDMLGLAT